MLGQTICNQSISSASTQIDLSQFPAGIYFLNISNNFQLKTYKINKQ
ncbi:MAG: T9SS type A sorting domain-containing protein [Bacteroidetes bacterium]|nr:T9SS type A sorting domain-containing protein [Bacteroidota bacterium]